jgi:hypothetical protein
MLKYIYLPSSFPPPPPHPQALLASAITTPTAAPAIANFVPFVGNPKRGSSSPDQQTIRAIGRRACVIFKVNRVFLRDVYYGLLTNRNWTLTKRAFSHTRILNDSSIPEGRRHSFMPVEKINKITNIPLSHYDMLLQADSNKRISFIFKICNIVGM